MVFKNVNDIVSQHRLVISGTPIQNSLKELWAIFDFACQGRLLGERDVFLNDYESVIMRGQDKSASKYDKSLADLASESLRELLKPYLLRRDKDSVKENEGDSSKILDSVQKNDFIVWLSLSNEQELRYLDFIEAEKMKGDIFSRPSPLMALNVMKKICDHHLLLEDRNLEDQKRNSDDLSGNLDKICESSKMKFLMELLPELIESGHRTLIFSQSKVILNMIQNILKHLVSIIFVYLCYIHLVRNINT
jgi:SNF2 family DNA or RNA helicase